MNCKKGDLAIVVDAPIYAQEFLGRIYACKSLTKGITGAPAWYVDGNTKSKSGYDVKCIEDVFLKPLDAPMNDEEITTDEPISLCVD